MAEKQFPKYPPFINRIKEQKYINDYLKDAPTSILFLYWPKSTGKTTLINKVINELPKWQYAVQYIDMRGVLLTDFEDFKNIFFPNSIKGKIKEIVSWIKVNVWMFGWDIDDEKLIQENVFQVMEQKLEKANEKWIKPVIIIDEFQYLRDIIIQKDKRIWENKDILLVEELWKFFIRLTKVKHLAHVICLTSDSYYIEELYNHAKLKNTSKYYLVDHLEKKDVVDWLKSEDFDDEIIEYFWENLGWSVWEIWQCLLDYKNTWDYKAWVESLIEDEYAKIFDIFYFKKKFTQEDTNEFERISKVISKKWEYILQKWDSFSNLITEMISIDIWFFDVKKQKITANSQTVRKAFEKL